MYLWHELLFCSSFFFFFFILVNILLLNNADIFLKMYLTFFEFLLFCPNT